MEHTLNIASLIIAITSAMIGALVTIVTVRSKIRKEHSEAVAKVIEAKTSLMEFTEKMDTRMAGYVEQLQMTRQKMLEMEERHMDELRSERKKTEDAISEIMRLRIEWERHKAECPVFLKSKKS